MRYKTILDYGRRDRLLDEILQDLHDGLWMLDLDPKAESVLVGPFKTIAEAHDSRDYIWHYGDQFGRYLWYVSPGNCRLLMKELTIIKNMDDEERPNIELEIDTLPLEIVSFRIINKLNLKSPKTPKKGKSK